MSGVGEKKGHGRGGRRPGAGRKPEGGRKTVPLTICARPKTVEEIKSRAKGESKTVSRYVLERLGFEE